FRRLMTGMSLVRCRLAKLGEYHSSRWRESDAAGALRVFVRKRQMLAANVSTARREVRCQRACGVGRHHSSVQHGILAHSNGIPKNQDYEVLLAEAGREVGGREDTIVAQLKITRNDEYDLVSAVGEALKGQRRVFLQFNRTHRDNIEPRLSIGDHLALIRGN